MATKVVTEWEENGYKYTIIATPIVKQSEQARVNATEEKTISIFEYFGNRTPESGTGQRVYEYAKKIGAKIDTQEIDTFRYTGKIMKYEKSFLDQYFNEIEGTTADIVLTHEDDDLPF